MGVQVQFNYTAWAALFPEFSTTVDSGTATLWLGVVTTLIRNDGGGPVNNANVQTQLLNFALAHLCFLYLGTNTQPPAQTVGRINSASEGSVAVTTDYGQNVGESQAFWIQSKYGAALWAMMLPYRTMRYLAPVSPAINSGQPWLYPDSGI